MKVLYTRVSSQDQNEARQINDSSGFDLVMVDKCSGSIPLYERPYGKRLYELIESDKLKHLEIHSIDRLGRSTIDVLNTWNELTEKGITVVCRNPMLRNFDGNGKADAVSEMIVSILSIMAKFERQQIKDRQAEGIREAKAAGKYIGRKPGTTESDDRFLNKEQTKKILDLLTKKRTYNEISKILGCSHGTIRKAKKLNALRTD